MRLARRKSLVRTSCPGAPGFSTILPCALQRVLAVAIARIVGAQALMSIAVTALCARVALLLCRLCVVRSRPGGCSDVFVETMPSCRLVQGCMQSMDGIIVPVAYMMLKSEHALQ